MNPSIRSLVRLSLPWIATVCLGCAHETPAPSAATAQAAAPSSAAQIRFGNGEANWILVEGVSRSGSTLTFKEVQIDGNGWLVLHPFKDGKPVGAIYSGSTYLKTGRNVDIGVDVGTPPAPGTMFLVMLHRDVNENQEFDFVFVDEKNVLDKAVFEGMTMIAHPFATP